MAVRRRQPELKPSPLLLWSKLQPPVEVRRSVLKQALKPLPLEALRRLAARLGAGFPVAMDGPWYSHDRSYGDPFCEALPGPYRRDALRAAHYPAALDVAWILATGDYIRTNPVIMCRGKNYVFTDVLSHSRREDLEAAVRDAVGELAREGHR